MRTVGLLDALAIESAEFVAEVDSRSTSARDQQHCLANTDPACGPDSRGDCRRRDGHAAQREDDRDPRVQGL